MQDILDIMNMPTVINNVHESAYRSYHILSFVKGLLERGTPPAVVVDLLTQLQNAEPVREETVYGR